MMAFCPWVLDSPDTLWESCLNYIVENLSAIASGESHQRKSANASRDSHQKKLSLKPGIFLTQGIADALLDKFHERGLFIDEHLLNLFCDTEKCRLQKLNLAQSPVSDRTFASLICHEPTDINIKGCQNLTTSSLLSINNHGMHLVSLSLGVYCNIFSELDLQENGNRNSDILKELMDSGLSLPNLRHLSIRNLTCLWQDNDILLSWILGPLTGLTTLDLTDSEVVFEESPTICNLSSLRHLCLHGVVIKDVEAAFNILIQLKNLRALDLSRTIRDQSGPMPAVGLSHKQAEHYLRMLVANLKHLSYLDLSSTGLVGPDPYKAKEWPDEWPLCSIPGLGGVELQLLGLLDCKDACARPHLPAKQVTGNFNEEQVLRSLSVYMDCPQLLRQSLSSLLFLIRYIKVHNEREALRVTLMALTSMKSDMDAMADGIMCLIFLTKKGIKMKQFSPKTRRQIITAVVCLLENDPPVENVQHRAWSCLTYFSLPEELLFVYGRVMHCGIHTLHWMQSQNVQNVILYVMKHMASQVDVKYKTIAGDIGIVSSMLAIIRRLSGAFLPVSNTLLRSWSILWSLTDLAPNNCQTFIETDGLKVFLDCLNIYSDEPSMVQKMMGMLCNIAEVEHLRPHLMETPFINAFHGLFDQELNISNSACGVMAYLLADGVQNWAVDNVDRESIINDMYDVISSWDITAKRNVRYRSFVPMMRLLQCEHTTVVQYWAAWEICNMTRKDPMRYCPMLEAEGSIDILRDRKYKKQEICTLVADILRMYEEEKSRLDNLPIPADCVLDD